MTLLESERKRRTWRTAIGLWTGAIAVGVIVGIAPNLFRDSPSAPAGVEPTLAIQTALEEAPTAIDQQWAARSIETSDPPAIPVRTMFGFCHTGGGRNCVVDGDTLWVQGQKVRVADIDAPETHDYHCTEEKVQGDRATQRLIQLVNSGPVTLQPIDRDEDRYGRKLRIVLVNGTSVGDTLVSEGLARYFEGGRRPWC